MEDIDLRQLWRMLRKRWIIVIALPIIAAITSGIISFYIINPVYQASTTLIVGRKASESTLVAEKGLENGVLLANQQLAKTYTEIAKSNTVEKNVIKDLDLAMSVKGLDSMISVVQVKTTEILEIQVTNTNPELAALIANSMAKEFSKAIIEIKKVDSVSIVDKAEIPDSPIKPNKTMNVLIAFLIGLMASVSLVILLEFLDNTVKTSSDVKELLGIPVLGLIAYYEKDKKDKKALLNPLITLEKTKSPISESYRTTRTNIEYTNIDVVTQKILITSSGPREGKSFTVANLAVSMAQSGKSVLIMDADMRNPTQHKLFGLDNGQGLSGALVQDRDYRNYIKETTVPGLMVLTGGPIPPNPAELVGSKRMMRLIEEASEQFDMVLIDTPPVIAVTDAAVLAQKVDGVILVLASGEVNKDYAQTAKEQLDNVGARILGAVLNKVDVKTGEYYYYYNYHGSDDAKTKKRNRHRAL